MIELIEVTLVNIGGATAVATPTETHEPSFFQCSQSSAAVVTSSVTSSWEEEEVESISIASKNEDNNVSLDGRINALEGLLSAAALLDMNVSPRMTRNNMTTIQKTTQSA